MKKLCFLLLSILITAVGGMIEVSAAEYKPVKQIRAEINTPENDEEIIEQLFSDLEDTDNVVILPDGGIIHGEVELVSFSESEKNNIVIEEYNSEEDAKAITVANAKSILNEQAENFDSTNIKYNQMLRASLPTKGWNLTPGASYRSNPFSGSGWVTSGYYFTPSKGSGNYLLWQTFLDDGVVGGYNQMATTLSGVRIEGTIVYTTMGRKLVLPLGNPSWNPGIAYFASFNPVRGSGYWVANKDS